MTIGFEAPDGGIRAVTTCHDLCFNTLESLIPPPEDRAFWERVHREYDPANPQDSMAGARTPQLALKDNKERRLKLSLAIVMMEVINDAKIVPLSTIAGRPGGQKNRVDWLDEGPTKLSLTPSAFTLVESRRAVLDSNNHPMCLKCNWVLKGASAKWRW